MKIRQNLLLLCLFLGTFLTSFVSHAATLTRTSSFAYDPTSGLLVKEVIEPDNSALCLVTEYTHDAYGNKTASTTRNCNGSTGEAPAPTGDAVFVARTTNDTYDARGQLPITSKNALGQSESKTYDAKFGVLTKLTGPNGLSTTWQYDSFGRMTLEIRADATQTRLEYLYCAGFQGGTATCPTIGGAVGKWLVKETPLASNGATQNGPVNKRYFDAFDREIRVETQGFDGSGTATAIYKDTHYDSLGRPYKASLPYYAGQTAYWITAVYDVNNRVIQETRPDGSIVTTSTDRNNGRVTEVTDPLGRTTVTEMDNQGRVIKSAAGGLWMNFHYDPFGNVIMAWDGGFNTVRMTYDLRGRKTGMDDPDMGKWTYVYNALGELVKQTDAKGQVTTMLYDRLGRLTQRSEKDLISNWYYDAYKSGATCQKGIGKLCQAETSTGYNRTASYDTLGRQTSSATTIDVTTPYNATVSYDANGRLATQSYPSGLVVKYVYTALGYLKEVRNNASNALYWRADTLDAQGHLLQQTYGNNVVTQQTWNTTTGRLTGILAGAGNSVQNLGYQYDKVGNLITRTDGNQKLSESFTYDSLYRLTSSTVNSGSAGIVTKIYTYNPFGDITKNELGTYTYPVVGYYPLPEGASNIRPHAVTQIALTAGGKITFAYDANGSLTTQTQTDASNKVVTAKGRSQFYTSFNMPQSMAQGTVSAAFYYGPEHQRVKQISSVQGTTIYVNPGNEGALFFEKDIKPNGSIEQRAFITVGGQAMAIVKTITSGGTTSTSTRYLHRDALDSVTAVTDESGAVLERLAYEPFGKRRFANGANDPNNTIAPLNTDRGYTGHEMLDEIGLIHMNGRVYDPLVGRFLSADPFVQDPYNAESYNRYSYVMNNPLGYTDPSGYFSLKSFFGASLNLVVANSLFAANPDPVTGSYLIYASYEHIVSRPGQEYVDRYVMQNSWAYSVGMVASTIITSKFCGGCGGAAWAAYYSYQSTGSVKEAYKAGAIAYATNYAFGWIGQNLSGVPAVLGHAAVGCASAAASGGNCGSGALAAGFGKIATIYMSPTSFGGNPAYQMAYVSVVGGTASVLGGGKFANGAATAAFGYLFNQMSMRYKYRGYSYEVSDTSPPNEVGALRTLQGLADQATATVDANGSWFSRLFRGTAIHTEFARLINALDPALGFSSEVSYIGGDWAKYGSLFSARVDAVYGPRSNPIAVFELKTGWNYMSLGELNKYAQNLPPGTPIYTIKPTVDR